MEAPLTVSAAPLPPPLAALTPSSLGSSGGGGLMSGGAATPSPSSVNGAVISAPVMGSGSHSQGVERSFAEALHDHFDSVYRRVTMGRRDLKSVNAHLTARAAAERAYADKVAKDAHAAPELQDSSSAMAVWKEVKEAEAAVSAQHAQLAALLTELSSALDKSIREVKQSKTSLQLRYNKMTDDCRTKQARHDKARDAYAEAVKQSEQAIIARDNGRQLPPPKQQQLENAVSRSQTLLSQRHEEYRRAVGVLKEAQVSYDAQMVDVMQAMERTEAERLRVFNECLQRFAAQHEQLAQAEAAVAAALHRSVQSIDNRRDIADYIALTTTNSRPRPHVEYHAITSAIIDQNAGRAAAPAPARMQQPPAAAGMGNGGALPAASYPPQQPAALSYPASGAAQLINPGGSAGLSAAAQAGSSKFIPPPVTEKFVPPPAAAAVGGQAVALYDFEGAEAEDLSFRLGDVIALRQADEAEDWWNGELRGRTGIFPKTYVRRQTAAEAALAGSAAPQLQQLQQPAVGSSTPEPGYEPAVIPSLPVAVLAASNGGPFATSAAVQPADLAAAASAPSASSSASPEQPREMDARCEALFDFVGQDVDELSFSKGEQLVITGELNGWYLGKRQGTNQVGIFPSNYVLLHVAQ